MQVGVRVLGPVVLESDGVTQRLGGPKERTVLAALALAPGSSVPASVLVDAVWGSGAPRTAIKTVQTYVSRLRRVVGDAIVSEAGCYKMTAWVDATKSSALADRARAAVALDDHETAARLYSDALALWRGDAVLDGEATAWVLAQQARLGELRDQLMEERVDSQLALGDAIGVVGEIEAMVAASPLRERRWAQLITALYRSGRQADALRAYQRLRTTLADELGIDPSPSLQELEGRVLRQDPELMSTPPSNLPSSRNGPKGRADDDATAPLPGPLLTRSREPFVGRDSQARTLAGLIVGDGRAVVLVTGEPGIGKSRLVAAAAASAHRRGSIVLYGRTDQVGGVPYQAITEALRHWMAASTSEMVTDVFGAHRSVLGALLPELGPADTRRDIRPGDRWLFFDAFDAVLSRLGNDHDVVLLLEDLHWADESTVQLISHVARSARPGRVRILGTYRDTEVGPTHPLRTTIVDLRRDTTVHHLPLDGLDLAGTTALVATGQADLDSTAIHELHLFTGGNPLFLSEIVQHIDAGARAPTRRDRLDSTTTDSVPERVREAVMHRVASLGPLTESIISVAAAVGTRFPIDPVRALSGCPTDEVDRVIDAAVGARILEPEDRPGWFSFSHAVIHAAMYSAIGRLHRGRLHEEVGTYMLSHRSDDRTLIAHHLLTAAEYGGSASRAAEAAAGAATWANEKYSYEDALVLAERGLTALQAVEADEPRIECELRLAMAVSYLGLGEGSEREAAARTAIELARRTGDVDQLYRTTLLLGGVQDLRDDRSAAGRLYDEALTVLPPQDRSRRAILLAVRSSVDVDQGHGKRGEQTAREAVEEAVRSGDDHAIATARFQLGYSWIGRGRAAERVELFSALASHRESAILRRITPAASFLGPACFEVGDRAGCEAAAGEVDQLVSDRRILPLYSGAWMARSLVALGDGRFDEAIALASDAYDSSTGEDWTNGLGTVSVTMSVAIERGELVEHLDTLEMISELPRFRGVRAGLAFAMCEVGRLDEAADIYTEFAADEFVSIPDDWGKAAYLAWLTDVCCALDHGASATALLEQLAPYEGTILVWFAGTGVSGAADRFRARLHLLLGEVDEAFELLRSARALESSVGGRALIVRTDLATAPGTAPAWTDGRFDNSEVDPRWRRGRRPCAGDGSRRSDSEHVARGVVRRRPRRRHLTRAADLRSYCDRRVGDSQHDCDTQLRA